ncbi:hypothetical protein Tco_1244032 [Tanacetum coccineum]
MVMILYIRSSRPMMMILIHEEDTMRDNSSISSSDVTIVTDDDEGTKCCRSKDRKKRLQIQRTRKEEDAVDVAVQLKYDRIREETTTANQQFLETIDDGMKKIIKEQSQKGVSKIVPMGQKLVTDQLESEVLVRSSKEANTSHAVAANLSELELKKILIDKMEANNSINRSDIQRQLYKALVEAYEADQILLDTYGDTVTIKRPRDGADDDEEPSAGTDRGSKRRRSGKEPASTSAPNRGSYALTDIFKGPQDRSSERCPRLNKIEEEEVYKATTEKLDWINPEGRQYPHDLRQPLPLVPNSQGRRVIPVSSTSSTKRSEEYLRGGVSSRNDGILVCRNVLNDRLKELEWSICRDLLEPSERQNARAMIRRLEKRLRQGWDNEELERFGRWTTLTGYKAVRLRFSDPMIQPEPEGSTQGYPLVRVEVLRHQSELIHNEMEILLGVNIRSSHDSILQLEVPDQEDSLKLNLYDHRPHYVIGGGGTAPSSSSKDHTYQVRVWVA